MIKDSPKPLPNIAKVAVPAPLRKLFDYACGSDIENLQIGDRVLVEFGNRELIGVVVRIEENLDTERKLKPVIKRLDTKGSLNTELLELCIWIADYYMHPIGEVIQACLPPNLRKEKAVPLQTTWSHTNEGKGLPAEALKRSPKQQELHQHLLKYLQLNADDIKTFGFSRPALNALVDKGLAKKNQTEIPPVLDTAISTTRTNDAQILAETPLETNQEQQSAIASIAFHHYSCSLLHGTTGSGKTEVYLHLSAKAIQLGKQVLVLVPEINLSPQLVARFRKRFKVSIVELHSDLSDTKRSENWIAIRSGHARIIIGTRLAALAPAQELGLIIVDEEHELAYKQQDTVRYSARDLCVFRANKSKIPVVLGSATPSLESLNHVLNKRYQHLVLKHRAGPGKPPSFQIIDLREQALTSGLHTESISAIRQMLSENKQVLVFLNRRGYAPILLCHTCGWMSDCPRCSASMTVHSRPPRLHCHHCDYTIRQPKRCLDCGSDTLDNRGIGTEQIEVQLSAIFNDTKVIRIDRDSTKARGSLNKALNEVNAEEACILVGTQMLAKGHHFAKLNLVVVVDGDQGFLNPDFRAMERSAQLLLQVSGRAGRESDTGKVLIQTHRPEHPALLTLTQRGYGQFALDQLAIRRDAALPPYWHCAVFRAESKRAENAQQFLFSLQQKILSIRAHDEHFKITGPTPNQLEKINERYRFQLLLRASQRGELRRILEQLMDFIDTQALARRVRWHLDIDPQETS